MINPRITPPSQILIPATAGAPHLPETDAYGEENSELRGYLTAVRRHLWLFLLMTVVGLSIAGYLAYREESAYRSQAVVLMKRADAPSA